MKILPARIGPTVCELLGPTMDTCEKHRLTNNGGARLPPMLNRSKVEMTACSGLASSPSEIVEGLSSSFGLSARMFVGAPRGLDMEMRRHRSRGHGRAWAGKRWSR